MKRMRIAAVVVSAWVGAWCAAGGAGDWPEPRHDHGLTAVQPVAGAMREAPKVVVEFDLGRGRPTVTAVDGGHAGLAIVAGALHCYDPAGKERWTTRAEGITFTRVVACEDLDGDGKPEVVLEAGRPAQPYGAVVGVSLADGRVLWREDVEPMSYSWQAYVGAYLPGAKGKQVLVVMQGYPPEPDNGYTALYEFPAADKPSRRWRYPFSAYTCFPNVFNVDLDGDGVKEICIISHSRMWVLDAPTGTVKQFIGWDVSPANVRSYGLNQFVDLDGDGRPDFVCLGNFSKHYEVLLNRGGKLVEAWHQGWADSVTTAHTAVCWPVPAFGDVDGDGKKELVVSVFENGAWRIRVHDAVTGAVKFEKPGVVAAGLGDPDGDGRVKILCDRAHDLSRSQPDGGYEIEKTDGAVVLAVREGKLEEVWRDDQARAVRAEGIHIRKDGQEFALVRGALETVPLPKPAPPGIIGPEIVGAQPQDILVADVLGDGRNQVLVYAKPTVRVLRVDAGRMEGVKEFRSDCTPVVADLDGDGKNELVVVENRIVRALRPATGQTIWEAPLPAGTSAAPWPGLLYLRAGRFLGHAGEDVYLMSGEPRVVSAVLDGRDGRVAWTKGEISGIERYWGPTQNLAAAWDVDGDGKQELVFTAPDYYCVADGASGEMRVGPVSPQKIFSQSSQGLYTLPAVLPGKARADDRVCLTAGHYFQGVMKTDATAGNWFRTPPIGKARSAREGFLQLPGGQWVMGFGRQDGQFECIDVTTGKTRWTLDLKAAATDTIACDVDGDGRTEFVFTTTDGHLWAVGDAGDHGRIIWKVRTAEGCGSAVAADVDGDGKSEIVLPDGDGRVKVYGAR